VLTSALFVGRTVVVVVVTTKKPKHDVCACACVHKFWMQQMVNERDEMQESNAESGAPVCDAMSCEVPVSVVAKP
jgi:hypothetical protein